MDTILHLYNCQVFALRAMDEHVGLQAEQFVIGVDENRKNLAEFQGRLAKTLTGNTDCKAKPKKIGQYCQPSNPHCFIGIL